MIENFLLFLLEIADLLEAVANLAISVSVAIWYYNRMWVSINLSCGSFEMRRKDINASNLTNLVSKHFFNGGRLTDAVREEVINLTNPVSRRVSKH